jgi:antitoxin (DNA-binding transcriptional repressor) of toxin-antitoxin stability system
MDDQIYDVADARKHLPRLIERVECGERITIYRDGRAVAVLCAVRSTPSDILARIDAVRERIRKRNQGRTILKSGETWRDLIEAGV